MSTTPALMLGLSAGVVLMVLPCQRNQDVDIQQIHASFLG
jgi:hypothetical protein